MPWILAVLIFCGGMLSETSAYATKPTTKIDFQRPDGIPHPAFNEPTPAKIKLGKILFFDPRLSGSNAFSCASCHNPALGWEDGLERAVGETGVVLPRHTPTILNLAWGKQFGWDGRITTLEGFVLGPIANADEMNQDLDSLLPELLAVPGYRKLFADAFPGESPSIDHISLAIAAFERNLVSTQAPFDRWINGDDGALTPDAQAGFELFTGKAGCAQCHKGWNFTDNDFHDIGLPSEDLGRGGLADANPKLRHTFKTPSLRQIQARAPYMHDGSLADLESVIEHYNGKFQRRPTLAKEIKPLLLTPNEKFQLRAFLASLSSTLALDAPPDLPER